MGENLLAHKGQKQPADLSFISESQQCSFLPKQKVSTPSPVLNPVLVSVCIPRSFKLSMANSCQLGPALLSKVHFYLNSTHKLTVSFNFLLKCVQYLEA